MQYTTAVVANNWGAHFDSRINDLETRMVDLELICLAEIHDECDDCVETLEQVVGELQYGVWTSTATSTTSATISIASRSPTRCRHSSNPS
jgi:hypothetical protein